MKIPNSITPQGQMILAMNRFGMNVYAGTVPAKEKARRRARNKVARQSRRINRGG